MRKIYCLMVDATNDFGLDWSELFVTGSIYEVFVYDESNPVRANKGDVNVSYKLHFVGIHTENYVDPAKYQSTWVPLHFAGGDKTEYMFCKDVDVIPLVDFDEMQKRPGPQHELPESKSFALGLCVNECDALEAADNYLRYCTRLLV